MQRIYFDNAATTPVTPAVLEAMTPYLTEIYGNPSSIYAEGAAAAEAVGRSRERIASALGADADEIFFTSGGSEADNWALKGAAYALAAKGKKHIITSAIEHHAVLHTAAALEKQGFETTYLPVDEYGLVSPADLRRAIRRDTAIVSVMYANNEIGTIEPVKELAAAAREAGVLFHTDAVQAMGQVPLDVKDLGVDLLSVSGHKLHAPKGVGALYIRRGVRIANLIDGGAQERSRRAGTENVASIVGFAAAAEEACRDIGQKAAKVAALRDKIIEGVLKIPYTRLNGHRTKRLPGNANFSISFIEGESILLSLDLVGIAASSGSACTSGSLDPSHVLLAIGLPHETAHGSLRISLSELNTESEADYLLGQLPAIVERLRAMSPLYEKAERR